LEGVFNLNTKEPFLFKTTLPFEEVKEHFL